MTNDVFDDKTQDQNPNDAAATDPYAPLLGSIRREDGTPKYDTVDKALTGLIESQSHIATLEAENEQLRQQAARALAAEQLLAKLQAKQNDQGTPQSGVTTSAPHVTQDQIEQLVAKTLDSRSKQEVERANREAFNSALTQRFGDRARDELVAAAKAKGWSMEDVKYNAVRNPQGMLDALGLNTAKPVQGSNPVSTVYSRTNTDPAEPVRSNYKTSKEFYEAVKQWTMAKLNG